MSLSVNDDINNSLVNLENKHNIKILFAVEAGSRAWNLHSVNSDYDIRFVYVSHPDSYLSIKQTADVITQLNGRFDIVGWDLKKALTLLNKSNPNINEWLMSGIIYKNNCEIKERLTQLAVECFSVKKCIYHYISIAKNNYKDLVNGDNVKVKKYLYSLRAIYACEYIYDNKKFPPLKMNIIMRGLPLSVKNETEELIHYKISGIKTVKIIPEINRFIEDEISRYENKVKFIRTKNNYNVDSTDKFFKSVLFDAWRLKIIQTGE